MWLIRYELDGTNVSYHRKFETFDELVAFLKRFDDLGLMFEYISVCRI